MAAFHATMNAARDAVVAEDLNLALSLYRQAQTEAAPFGGTGSPSFGAFLIEAAGGSPTVLPITTPRLG